MRVGYGIRDPRVEELLARLQEVQTVDSDDEDVQVKVSQGGKTVAVLDPRTKKEIEVNAGPSAW